MVIGNLNKLVVILFNVFNAVAQVGMIFRKVNASKDRLQNIEKSTTIERVDSPKPGTSAVRMDTILKKLSSVSVVYFTLSFILDSDNPEITWSYLKLL